MRKYKRKQNKNVAKFILLLLALSSTPAFALTTFTNTSSFYLNNNTSWLAGKKITGTNSSCPAQIAPGQIVNVSGVNVTCGYVPCSTSNYSSDPSIGCQEPGLLPNGKTGLTSGGYISWFSVNFQNGTCNVPDNGNNESTSNPAYIPFQCSLDSKGNFDLNYKIITQKYTSGNNLDTAVTIPAVSQYTTAKTFAFRGVNVSGLEYDGTFPDALFQHPDIPDVRYFAAQGMNTIRLPIRWEFLLYSNNSPVESHIPDSPTPNMMYIQAVHDTVQKYLAAGLNVDLDLHNYMRFCQTGVATGQLNEPTNPAAPTPDYTTCQLVTQEQFVYIWNFIAEQFSDLAKQYPKQLIFELMNEPYWVNHANQNLMTIDLFNEEVAAVKAIRAQGLQNLILLSGNYWDPLHDWTTNAPNPNDVPNGNIFTQTALNNAGVDTSNIALDMHQYFNSNYSGVTPDCNQYASYADFKNKLGLDDVATWIKANHMKTFLGEFGASDSAVCQQDLNYMMQYINENACNINVAGDCDNGGFIGWTVWRANRHGNTPAFAPFNFLQQADPTVYGGGLNGGGPGIIGGQGNDLMTDVFANYLTAPQQKQ